MQRKGLVLYEPIGWLSASELDLLKKLKIDPSLYLNKDVYFNESKQIKWIGELEDKLPEGEGVFLLHDLRKVVIVVEAKAGQKNGYGKVYLDDGSFYEVQFRNDDCDGISDYFAANGQKILTANFNHNKLVELKYVKTGEVYLGEHSFLMRHGRGKQFKDASQTMESIISNGIFENDKFVKGYAKHEYYVGDLDQGVYQGHGTLYYDRGYKRKLMAGTFKNGKLDGWGQEFFENDENDLKYEGNFVEGVYEGDGSLMVLEPEKRIYRGKFRNGEPQLQFDILDQEQRVLQKVTYKNGKIIEILEDYMYNVKLPSTQEITEEEVNAGEVETQVMAKVVYARQLSSVRYYRNIKDENPYYMMQVDPKLFNIKYEGIVNRKGSLIYSGDMRNILFEGKGTLRYAAKNEPRKYVGTFVNGLFDGTGELYLLNNQMLYIGQFKQNKFHGAGKLTIHSIFLTGTEEMSAQQLKAGTFGADRYDVEVEGQFSEGKFSNGVWMYTGVSEAVMDRVLAMKVEKQTKDKIEGKMYERKVLVYEGTFFHYQFDGKGVLYYKDGVQKKYEGGFKNGQFEGFGQLYDRKGKLVYAGDFTNGSYNGKGKLYQGLEENLIYEGELKDGRVMGQGKMLESDGKTLRSEGYYQDCVLTEGYVKIYSQVNKKILYEGSVKDGLYDGTGVLYNSAGEACVKGTFKKGDLIDGIKKEFHNDGSLKREGHVKHGNYEGHVKEFFYDGKVMFEGDYKNGERNGEGIAYHRNGQPKQKGIFKDNVFYDGDAMYYFEDNVTKMFVGKIKNMYYNGHGIRYFENGALEYEGTFKNGLYDGDGIYYYFEEPGRIKFKGKFGDGRPDGEGEYFDLSGRLIFKGRFVNWRKEGPGILYSSTGEKIMEGTFDDDRLYQGYGKILWPGFGTVKYEGEFSGGYQEGKGKTFFTNNFKEFEGDFKGNYFDGYGVLYSEHEEGAKVYEGHFSKGKYHGSGVHYGKEEIYDGEYKQGKKFGEGILKYRDPNLGVIFEGKFESDDMIDGHANIRDPKTKTLLYSGGMKKGKYDGQAVKYFKDGKKEYEGTFKYGLFDGQGTKYSEDGTKEYEGEYIRGVITGDGKIYQHGVLRYDGKTLKGVYHGTGTLYDEDGKVIYKGSFNNGKYDGKGALYHPRSTHIKYEGNFADGVPQGFGKRYNKNGELKYEGTFEHGKYQGEGVLYYPDTGVKKYEGTFSQKVADGKGTFYGPGGNKLYEGDVLNGVYQGNGVLYYDEEFPDKPYYEGEFQNGVPHGQGLFKYSNEVLQYQGEVNNGTYHGKGTYYHADGKVKANGSFINGKYNAP